MVSITELSIGEIQGSSNKMHNQEGAGINSHKIIFSDTKQNKTSPNIDVSLIRKIKGNRQVRTTINRMETRTDKVYLTAALHTGAIRKKFNSRQRLHNKTTLAATNRKHLAATYTCSNQQQTSGNMIRPPIKLQAIPVTHFNRDLKITQNNTKDCHSPSSSTNPGYKLSSSNTLW